VPRTPSQAAAFVIGVWIALWLLCPTSASAQARGALVGTSTWPASMPPAAEFTPLEAELHRSVNGVRSQAGLIELRRDPVLDAVAREHSLDMAQRHYFAHETPEGLNPVDRLKRGGGPQKPRGRGIAAAAPCVLPRRVPPSCCCCGCR